jgi:hypothetical protein
LAKAGINAKVKNQKFTFSAELSKNPMIHCWESASHPTLPFLVKGKCPKYNFLKIR